MIKNRLLSSNEWAISTFSIAICCTEDLSFDLYTRNKEAKQVWLQNTMSCVCSCVKYLFFLFGPQPRWRLVAITQWWGWCPVGTTSTEFPSSTDYWNTTSSPRPERTAWIISALWNETTHTHTHTHTQTHTYKPTDSHVNAHDRTAIRSSVNKPV